MLTIGRRERDRSVLEERPKSAGRRTEEWRKKERERRRETEREEERRVAYFYHSPLHP